MKFTIRIADVHGQGDEQFRMPFPTPAEPVRALLHQVNQRLQRRSSPLQASKLVDSRGAVILLDDSVESVLDDGECLSAICFQLDTTPSAGLQPSTQLDSDQTTESAVEADDVDQRLACSTSEIVVTVHGLHFGQPTKRQFCIAKTATFLELQERIRTEHGVDSTLTPLIFTEQTSLSPDKATLQQTLKQWGLTTDINLYCVFRAPSIRDSSLGLSRSDWLSLFFAHEHWQPSIKQDTASLACFTSALYVVLAQLEDPSGPWQKVYGHIRRLSGFPPTLLALQYLRHHIALPLELSAALSEGFYFVCRHMVSPTLEPSTLFSHSRQVWAHLFDGATDNDALEEIFPSIAYVNMQDPVRLRGADGSITEELYERDAVMVALTNRTSLDRFPHPQLHPYFRILEDPEVQRLLKGVPELLRREEVSIFSWKGAKTTCTPQLGLNAMKEIGIDNMWQLADAEISTLRFLRMVPALSLRSSVAPVLTWSETGNTAVFTGLTRSVVLDCELLDPVENATVAVNSSKLAAATKTFVTATLGAKAQLDIRPTTEAIMVLFDASQSMSLIWAEGETIKLAEASYQIGEDVEITQPRWGNNWHFAHVSERISSTHWVIKMDSDGSSLTVSKDCIRKLQNMSRLTAAKRLLDAFTDRSKAFDFPHEIGLTVFCSQVTTPIGLTRMFDEFEAHVEKVKAQGNTRLFDALKSAGDVLCEFQSEHPNSKLRILCLTDGEDTGSTQSAHVVTKILQQKNIVVDAMLIGGSDNKPLMGITSATGGLCFNPKSITEALKILELEKIIALDERDANECVPKPPVNSLSQLLSYATNGYAVEPEAIRPRQVQQLTQTAATPSAALARVTQDSASKPSQAYVKRVVRELSDWQRSPPPNTWLYPSADDVTFWRIIMKGPAGTPYVDGFFLLTCEFTSSYPFKPPNVRFVTPIYHCNVNSAGKACLPILARDWSPAKTAQAVIASLAELMADPNPDDPIDTAKAEEYHMDKSTYLDKAKEFTKKHASKTLAEFTKEFGITDDDPEKDDVVDNATQPATQ